MEEFLKQIAAIDIAEGEQPVRAMFPTGGFNHLPLIFHGGQTPGTF